MPIWLRNFTFTQIKEHFDKQNEESKPQSTNKALGPDIQPTYNTKASK